MSAEIALPHPWQRRRGSLESVRTSQHVKSPL